VAAMEVTHRLDPWSLQVVVVVVRVGAQLRHLDYLEQVVVVVECRLQIHQLPWVVKIPSTYLTIPLNTETLAVQGSGKIQLITLEEAVEAQAAVVKMGITPKMLATIPVSAVLALLFLEPNMDVEVAVGQILRTHQLFREKIQVLHLEIIHRMPLKPVVRTLVLGEVKIQVAEME
jgi:hypothetical protein